MNIIDSGNYLVQLYFKTGKKYSLTATKLNYLLVIAELCHLKSGFSGYSSFSFVETSNYVHRYSWIGFPLIYNYYFSDIVEGELEEDGIISEKINEEILIPKHYQIKYELNDEERNLLNNIFFEFGNVPSLDIRNMLYDFFDRIKGKLNKTTYTYKYETKYVFDNSDVVKSFFEDFCYNINPIMRFVSESNSEIPQYSHKVLQLFHLFYKLTADEKKVYLTELNKYVDDSDFSLSSKKENNCSIKGLLKRFKNK